MAKRYYNLEKETKEYLKACDNNNITPSVNISIVNDYAIRWKTFGRYVTSNTLLSRFGISLSGLRVLADPALPDSWDGSTFNDIFTNTPFARYLTRNLPEYTTEFNAPSFNYKLSFFSIYRNSTISTSLPTSTSTEYSRFAVFRCNSFNSTEVNGAGFQPIFGNAFGGNQIDMGLCTSTTGKLAFNQYANYISPNIQYQGNTTLNLNTWNFGGFTYSKSLSTMKFYLNGVLDRTFTSVNFGNANSNNLIIGGVEATIAPNRFFDGYIGPVLHYDKVVTDTEILQTFNSYKNRFRL
jgi:hypothetical protein